MGKNTGWTIVEPQHKMYWNTIIFIIFCISNAVEPQHKMYWNPYLINKIIKKCKLNRNIRCIEMLITMATEFFMPVEPQHKMYWNLILFIKDGFY